MLMNLQLSMVIVVVMVLIQPTTSNNSNYRIHVGDELQQDAELLGWYKNPFMWV